MAPKRKAPACAKVEGETADGIKYVRHESGMLVIGTSSSRRTVRHAGDDVEARVEKELSADGGALRRMLAPVPAECMQASSKGELSVPPYGTVPTATMPTASVLTPTVSPLWSPQARLLSSQDLDAPQADTGFLVAQAAACMPWSDPDDGPPSRSDIILLKDHDHRRAYRCALCRHKSCRMALNRVQCQRRAASRDEALHAQWHAASRVRDLIIEPVWHLRRMLARAPGNGQVEEHFEMVILLPLGPLTPLKQQGSETSFEAEWSFPVVEREQGSYAERRGGRRPKGRYRLQVRWPSRDRVRWEERTPFGELSKKCSLTGLRRGWISETHCSLFRSMQQATAADRRLAHASVVTFQVPVHRRESSLFSVLARKEGEEGRRLHSAECPCDVCEEWRARMRGASDEYDCLFSGVVLESEAELESDVQSDVSDMHVDEDGGASEEGEEEVGE